MTIDLIPTLKSMRTSALGFILITLQVVLSIAVVVNAFSGSRWLAAQLNAETGLNHSNLIQIDVYGFNANFVVGVDSDADLAFLRGYPNVVNAVQSNAVPLSNSGWYTSLRTSTEPEATSVNAAQYMFDEHALDTLNLELILGRNFLPEEIVWRDGPNAAHPPSAIVTESLATKLFPDLPIEEVLGETVYYDGDNGSPIVGILKRLPQPNASSDNLHDSFVLPQKLTFTRYSYIVRVEDGLADSLIPDLESELLALNPHRLVTQIRTLAETFRQSSNGNFIVVWIFSITSVLLAGTTMLSIVGVGNFNIRRRTRQICIRRVLGATKTDIVSYFVIEILLVLVIGLAIGLLVASSFNVVLVSSAEFPKLNWVDIVAPTSAFLILGLVSVAATALQTTKLSPVPR